MEDQVRFYGITRYHPGTVDLLLLYAKVTKDYDQLTSKQKEKIGYAEELWKTPNLKLMIEMYKLHKVLKIHKPEYMRDGEKGLWIIKPSGNARGMGIH